MFSTPYPWATRLPVHYSATWILAESPEEPVLAACIHACFDSLQSPHVTVLRDEGEPALESFRALSENVMNLGPYRSGLIAMTSAPLEMDEASLSEAFWDLQSRQGSFATAEPLLKDDAVLIVSSLKPPYWPHCTLSVRAKTSARLSCG